VFILRGLESAPPFVFAGLRTTLGGATILLFAKIFSKRVVPEKRLWKWILPVALTATTLTFGSMFLSPSFTGAGMASILGNAQPVFIALIGFMSLGERLSKLQTASLLLCLLGVMNIVLPSAGEGSDGMLTGTLLALSTSLAAAVGSVLARHVRLSGSLLSFTSWQLLIGGAGLLILSVAIGEPPVDWNWNFTGILVLLAVFNSAIGNCAWFFLLQREKAGKLSIYLFLTPVLGVAWALVFEGERPAITSLAGGVLVLFAVVLPEFKGFRRGPRFKG
jgi:drug/metabolite transporter (DMT)-like permease